MTQDKDQLKSRINDVLSNKNESLNMAYTKSLEELVEDLKIYQYELEFQNDELLRIQFDLENSRNSYEQLFQYAPVGYAIIDENYRIVKSNQLFNTLFEEKLIEKPDLDIRKLIAAGSQDLFYHFSKRLLKYKDAETVEIEMIPFKGKSVFMQVTGNIFVSNGQYMSRLSFQNVTEQKAMIQALAKSEFEKRTITDNMTDMVVVSEPDGKIRYVSPSIKLFGFTQADYMGKSIFDFVHPSDIDSVLESFQNAVGQLRNDTVVFRLLNKSKGFMWVETSGSLVLNEMQEIESAVFVVRNIEEKKKSENELKYTRNLLEQVGHMAQIGAWELELSTDKLFWSNVIRNIFEISDDYQPSLTDAINFYLEGSDRDAITKAVAEAIENRKAFDLELQIKTSKSNVIWVRSMGLPIYTDNKLTHIRGLFQNVNEKKLSEIRLTTFSEELQEINRTKDKMFSILAHDLRSPFNAFLNLTQLLDEEIETFSKSEIKHITKTIYSSAINLNSLIENLLEWSRLQRGLLKPVLAVHVVRETIQNVVDSLSESAANKTLNITIEANERFIARYDKGMLSTVIRNLTSNAIKFTPRNGTIQINVEQEETHFTVDIMDSGIGVPSEIRTFLFEINDLKSRNGTDGEKSSGLGLMICKEFVELHHGTIWLKESNEKGSCFSFKIPIIM